MAGVSGSAYSTTDELAKAPGSSVDAGVRGFRNTFNFADAGVGGTTNPILLARVPRGATVDAIRLSSSVDASGINVIVGKTGSTNKYVTTTAGPAAGVTKRFDIVVARLADDPLTDMEEIIMTPSGNWPATGTLVSLVNVLKR